MLRRLYIILIVSVIAGAVICTLRWQAWFGMPEEPTWLGDTLACHFFVLSDSNAGDRGNAARFLVLGDVHNRLDSADYRSIRLRHENLSGLLQLGDWIERPYFYYEQKLMHQLARTGIDSLPVLAVPGNHEYRKGIFPSELPGWEERFSFPQNGPIGFEGRTYYQDYGPIRFVGIDTYGLNSWKDYKHLRAWLRVTFRHAEGRYLVVLMHQPVHSCAKGRQNLLIRFALADLLDCADLVLAGHDHSYSRQIPYVVTNAADKYYPQASSMRAEMNIAECQVYQVLSYPAACPSCEVDSLTLETYSLKTGELLDKVAIHRQ